MGGQGDRSLRDSTVGMAKRWLPCSSDVVSDPLAKLGKSPGKPGVHSQRMVGHERDRYERQYQGEPMTPSY